MNGRFLLSILSVFLCVSGANAQSIVNPSIKGKTSFAVVIDSVTNVRCASAIAEYKNTIESEGLPVFVVSSQWKNPDEIRAVLKDLHDNNSLEGCVFIGNVPVPMITKAQFLTSAYKMDERKFPIDEVAVPSDRFYDDFDLSFVKLDTLPKGNHFFYDLAPDSRPYIESDIYSARIVPQTLLGDPYQQISDYLKKAVRMHKENNPLDNIVSYTGQGSYSNSLVAYESQRQTMHEQFGDDIVFKMLRFDQAKYMKYNLIDEMRRHDVDMMAFHEHGDFDRMYISEDHGPKDSLLYKNAGIEVDEIDTIAPNPRFVLFDACYNGDFRHDDFIAGEFVMGRGDCVVAWANSVNVLQDKSAFDHLGLLAHGVRFGVWARDINILESHLIGDPTFRFIPAAAGLDKPDSQCIKIEKMARKGGYSDKILKIYKSSPYAVVRYECLLQLQKINDANFRELLKLSQDDSFEFIRRVGATAMGYCGDEEFAPILVKTIVEDHNSERVLFDAKMALQCFAPDLIRKSVNEYFKDKADPDSLRSEILSIADSDSPNSSLEAIKAHEHKGLRVAMIQYLRNEPYHCITPDLIKVMQDPTEDVLIRTLLVESFAWYRLSVCRPEILQACQELLSDPSCPEEMKTALTNACNRLKN